MKKVINPREVRLKEHRVDRQSKVFTDELFEMWGRDNNFIVKTK